MISVIEVYNTVRDLCNKDQKGFVTPKVFNIFAEVAQQNVFTEMFKELSGAKQLRARNLDPSGSDSVYRSVKDDLSNFVTQAQITGSDSPLFINSNTFNRPNDTYKIISLRYDVDGEENVASWAEVELIYDSEKIPHILNSNLSTPTAAYPVALISNVIQIFPSDELYVGSLVITYYRQPASKYPTAVGAFAYGDVDTTSGPRLTPSATMDDGFVVPDILSSRHFELPEHYKGEIISEIAKMIGIRLRDEFITAYGTQETTSN
jgi:hypothetical protein